MYKNPYILKNVDPRFYMIMNKLKVSDIIILYEILGVKFFNTKNMTRQELYLIANEAITKYPIPPIQYIDPPEEI